MHFVNFYHSRVPTGSIEVKMSIWCHYGIYCLLRFFWSASTGVSMCLSENIAYEFILTSLLYLAHLTWMVCEIGSKWSYKWCFAGCCLHNLFKIAALVEISLNGIACRVQETGIQSQVESYWRLKKCFLMRLCLTLSIIRYGFEGRWSNPGKGVVPPYTSM